jgi:hypothetical protein
MAEKTFEEQVNEVQERVWVPPPPRVDVALQDFIERVKEVTAPPPSPVKRKPPPVNVVQQEGKGERDVVKVFRVLADNITSAYQMNQKAELPDTEMVCKAVAGLKQLADDCAWSADEDAAAEIISTRYFQLWADLGCATRLLTETSKIRAAIEAAVSQLDVIHGGILRNQKQKAAEEAATSCFIPMTTVGGVPSQEKKKTRKRKRGHKDKKRRRRSCCCHCCCCHHRHCCSTSSDSSSDSD